MTRARGWAALLVLMGISLGFVVAALRMEGLI